MIRPGVIVSLLLYARLLLALLLLPHLRLNIPPRQPAVPFRLNLGRIHIDFCPIMIANYGKGD